MDVVTFLVSAMATGALVLGLALARQNRVIARGHDAPYVPLRNYEGAMEDYADLLAHDVELAGLLRQHAPHVPVRPLPSRRTGHAEARPSRQQLREYRALLYDSLSEEELRNAAFDLSLDLNGSLTRGMMLRKLLEYLEERGQEAGLIAWLAKHRPDIKLE
jgi:hypothetical protein